MACHDNLPMVRTPAAKHACRLLGLILALTATVTRASEPMTFYGFDEAAYSSMAREGIEAIFAGQLFYSAVPASAARLLLGMSGGAQKSAGFTPGSPEGKFYASGRLP